MYELNQAVAIYSDVDEFLALYHAGQQAASAVMIQLYEQACRLYTGPFLLEDLYTDWSFIRREELNKIYVIMCNKLAEFKLENGHYEDAATWATATLKVNRCDEEAHRLLMRAYAAEGRRSEALRQYEHCQRVLLEELGVQPTPETQQMLSLLLHGTFSG
jgi:DNA-binding SARP family transcriptional activator